MTTSYLFETKLKTYVGTEIYGSFDFQPSNSPIGKEGKGIRRIPYLHTLLAGKQSCSSVECLHHTSYYKGPRYSSYSRCNQLEINMSFILEKLIYATLFLSRVHCNI